MMPKPRKVKDVLKSDFSLMQTWSLLRYSSKDCTGHALNLQATEKPLIFELSAERRVRVTFKHGEVLLDSFYLTDDVFAVEIVCAGDSMSFLFRESNNPNVKKHLRVRFQCPSECPQCKIILERFGASFLEQAKNSDQALSNTQRPLQHDIPKVSGANTRLAKLSQADQQVLAETLEILFNDPTFPEFVDQVELIVKNNEHRVAETAQIREMFPNRVPIVIEKQPNSRLATFHKPKLIVPVHVTVEYVIITLKTHLNHPPEKNLVILANSDTELHSNLHIGEVYDTHKDEDGFLYMTYMEKSVDR